MNEVELEKESRNIMAFIKIMLKQTKANGLVLGLSGGLDSAVIAVLSKKAVGDKRVHCVYMPEYEAKPDSNKDHIIMLCKKFDLHYQNIAIGNAILSVDDNFMSELKQVTEGNIIARLRMLHLYAIANELDCLVTGTSNRTELALGYFTKYGDGGCDFEPLGHLYKTEVFELARLLEIPNAIVDKPPSAGLWTGQTDEKEIGLPYSKIDDILKLVDKEETWKISTRKLVKNKISIIDFTKVHDMVAKSKHKRIMPPTITGLI